MRQRRNNFAQNVPVVLHIPRPYLQKVVERPGNHVAFLDLGHLAGAVVEGPKREFGGIGQLYLCECDMLAAQSRGVDNCPKTQNKPAFAQPVHPYLARCLGEPDPFCKLCYR